MEIRVGDALTKIEPLSGGAPFAAPVTLSADHTGSLTTLALVLGLDVIGELKSSTSPLLVRAATSTAESLVGHS